MSYEVIGWSSTLIRIELAADAPKADIAKAATAMMATWVRRRT
jgi:hypothetical protein